MPFFLIEKALLWVLLSKIDARNLERICRGRDHCWKSGYGQIHETVYIPVPLDL